MATRRKMEAERPRMSTAERLELIRQRHLQLILEPRKMIALDIDSEYAQRSDPSAEAGEFEMADVAEVEHE